MHALYKFLLHANIMAFDHDVLCKLWSQVNVAAISLDAVAYSYLVIDVLLNKLIKYVVTIHSTWSIHKQPFLLIINM